MQRVHVVTPSKSLRRMLAPALAVVLLAPLPARAQYPDKPVRIIVPVAAGGGVDVMARLIAQKLSERLGQLPPETAETLLAAVPAMEALAEAVKPLPRTVR